jgi:phenylpropionate dioxygenase-like ring-hydroxylating dioxygenase large terminal subunit
MDARDDEAVWNAWYPIGSPVDLRRQRRGTTRLLDRTIGITIHPTWISVSSEGRLLPVFERLGYVWTTLGEPSGPPPALPEYYEVDRITMNVWSTRLRCSGLRVVDNVVDNAHYPFLHPGILGDADHTELPPYENSVDAAGTFWSKSHKAYLPITGSVAEYTYRVPTPYSVILCIHRPVQSGEAERFDYLALFCQPDSQDSFIAHKMLAWVREDWMDEKRLRADQQWISVQDKYALERHTCPRLPLSGEHEASVGVDAASLAYRAWLRAQNVRYGARGGEA